MSTYRVEWPCGCVTETQAWEPDSCPMCTPDFGYLVLKSKMLDLLHLLEFSSIATPSVSDADQAIALMQSLRAELGPKE